MSYIARNRSIDLEVKKERKIVTEEGVFVDEASTHAAIASDVHHVRVDYRGRHLNRAGKHDRAPEVLGVSSDHVTRR